MKIEYQLTDDNVIEYQLLQAFQDSKTQARCFRFMVSLVVAIGAGSLLIIGWDIMILVPIILGIILVLLLFPRLYWQFITERVGKMIRQVKKTYPFVRLDFKDNLRVKSANETQIIENSQLVGVQATKNNYIVFYKQKDQTQAIIIPLEALEKDLAEFDYKVRKEIKDAQK